MIGGQCLGVGSPALLGTFSFPACDAAFGQLVLRPHQPDGLWGGGGVSSVYT